MPVEDNKAIVHRLVEAFNTNTLNRLNELLVADYMHHDPSLPPEMQRGRNNYVNGLKMFRAAFPDYQITVEDLIAEGDKVAGRWIFRGTHQGELMGIPPTGRQISFPMMVIHRFAGGQIVEGWVNFDALGMMQQLGVIPASGQAGR